MAYQKRHEKCVLFLEDAFGTEVWPRKLAEAGFEVQCFAHNFSKAGRKEESVKDPKIIRYCNLHKYLLVTTDKAIRYTHIEEIKKTDIGILATESNKGGMAMWTAALITAKPRIERLWKRHPWPWVAYLARTGEIRRVETITKEMTTRRHRRREQELVGE